MKVTHLLARIRLGHTSRDMLIGIAVALLIGANILLSSVQLRLDLSRGKAYSLSPATVKILQKVTDPIEITYFLSDNIPASFIPTKNQVNDLLAEYRRTSGKVTVKYLDPRKGGTDAQNVVQEYGIQPSQFSQLESDQYAVASGYFSLGVKVKDNKVSIQRLDPDNLEYNITSIVYKLTQGQGDKVGVAGASPAFTALQQGAGESLSVLEQVLGQQFTLDTPSLEPVPDDIRTLVLLDSDSSPLTDEATKGVADYLSKGGKMVLFTSSGTIGDSLTVATRESKLTPVLRNYGVKVNQDLALSNQAEVVNFGNDIFNRGRYPFWLITNVFNPDASYTANISHLMFPWTSTLTLTKTKGITHKEIVRTTDQSWVRGGNVDVRPESITPPASSELASRLLIAYAKDDASKGEMMVIPSTRFVQDNYLGRSGNLEFVINIVNEFASGGALSGIRSRSLTSTPLPTLDPNTRDLYKWANVLVLPALLGVWGVLRLKKRG